MKDETRRDKKEPRATKSRLNSQTSGKEGNKESNTLGGLLMLGTLGFFGSLLYTAHQKTISLKKRQKPETVPGISSEEESVEQIARRLRELLDLPTPEWQKEIRGIKQKEILEKLQSRMKPEDWPLVEEILRKPKSPQGQ